jgi:hypothetical protein
MIEAVPWLIPYQTNALTDTVFDEALSQARALDGHLQKTGELRGPLHGIPVSVKEQFNLKGVDTTLGYVGRAFAPATEDAAIVQILKELGAVVFVKTNLPQTLMVRLSFISDTVDDKLSNYRSGLKRTITSGAEQSTHAIPTSLRVALRVVRAPYWLYMAPFWDWARILEGVSGFLEA